MMSRRSFLVAATRAAAAVVILAGVGAAAVPGPAAAASLDQAKAAGLVGERPDGYLGLVDNGAPADVRQMVERINDERRQKYAEVAQRTGANVREVGILAGRKLIGGTASGNYYMNAQGQWVRR